MPLADFSKISRPFIVSFVIVAVAVIALFVAYRSFFGAPSADKTPRQFTIPLLSSQQDVVQALKARGFIRSEAAFEEVLLIKHITFRPGGYMLAYSMNAWQVADMLSQGPSFKWVVIPEGLRKEEIAAILADTLGWSDAQKQQWISVDTTQKPDYTEGVYFPDTYLIPVDATPAAVARRLQAKFAEIFAPYASEALRQNIKWTTLLKLASIIQREAADSNDMPLIAGILWNRLRQGMKLQVDATVQYARGDTGKGWWAPITPADKEIDSPYNTYMYAGLPPRPISNPGLSAILAVLKPATTSCLYYLHDHSRTIHCADTYGQHLKNITRYLR